MANKVHTLIQKVLLQLIILPWCMTLLLLQCTVYIRPASVNRKLEDIAAVLPQCKLAGSALHAAHPAVAVEVSSPELPTVLKQQIAAQLHHKWQGTRLQAG